MRLHSVLKYAFFFVLGGTSSIALAANTYCIDPDMDATLAGAAGCDTTTQLFPSIASFDGSGVILSSGDRVLFKRGVIYREQLTVSASGSVDNPIKYDAYGDPALPKPKIVRTDPYDGWWLNVNGLIHNASMEKYDTTTNTEKDDFVHWGEVVIGCSLNADSTVSKSGKTSMKMMCDPPPVGDLAKATAYIYDLKPDTSYTLSAHAMSQDAAGPNMSIIMKYHQPDGSLKYPYNGEWVDSGINTQIDWTGAPDIWIEKSVDLPTTLTDADGNSGWFEILFFSRGTYPSWLDDVSLTEAGVNHPKIWVGTLPGVKYSYGAIVNGERLPVVQPILNTQNKRFYPQEYIDYYNYFEADSLGDLSAYNADYIKENRFYMQGEGSNSSTSPFFYIRNDSGNPGSIEVAARKYSIVARNRQWISISNIDVEGPTGKGFQNQDSFNGGALIRIMENSQYIDINNIEASLADKIGIAVEQSTSHVNIDYTNVHDNGSTGIYNSANTGTVTHSLVHNNGNVLYDYVPVHKSDDLGGIGTNGSNITIFGNTVYHNGPDGDANLPAGYEERETADFEISAHGASFTTIAYNHVYDCIQGCIQIARSPDSKVMYNIIDGFGSVTNGNAPTTYGAWSGIRVGAKSSKDGSANAKIYNNIITGGKVTHANRHATIMFYCGNNSGAEVRNNIIFDNTAWHVWITDLRPETQGGEGDDCLDPSYHYQNNNSNITFSNNLYENINSDYNWYGWVLRDVAAANIDDWQCLTGISCGDETGSIPNLTEIADDPLFDDIPGKDFHIGNASSPAINGGTPAGLDTDFDGNPILGLPDIGAYEYNTDTDNDGHESDQFIGGMDCNDNDPSTYPGALEVSFDGIDQNCDQGPDATIDAMASHKTAGGGSVTVEATSNGGQSDTLTVSLTPDGASPVSMTWVNKKGGRWITTIDNMPSNPGFIYVSGVEGRIQVDVTSR